jgi:pyruvate dehydrogenase E1 component alpha subunit
MARDSVDGNDVFAVRSCLHTAIRRAREHSSPTLIEAKTYRYRGHSMADPGTYRTKEEVEEWKKRDPVKSVGEKLDSLGFSAVRNKIDQEVETEVQDAVSFAESSPLPAPETAANYVYALLISKPLL